MFSLLCQVPIHFLRIILLSQPTSILLDHNHISNMLSFTGSDAKHAFSPAGSTDKRSPCPALNAMANHGYLPRTGTDISFTQLIHAMTLVYNISLSLALFLAIPAFFIYGEFHPKSMWQFWSWHLTIHLDSLAQFGDKKIAHCASFVHPDHPSHAPNISLLHDFLSLSKLPKKESSVGLSFTDFARVRVIRESAIRPPMHMNSLHEQIALGEGGVAWLVLRGENTTAGRIPQSRLEQWFGEERLPDGWWDGVRPSETVTLFAARRQANELQREMAIVR